MSRNRTIYTKADVDTYGQDRSGHPRPAVNVKCYASLESVHMSLPLGRSSKDNGKTWQRHYTHKLFTVDWVREHLSEGEIESAWEATCEQGWETLRNDAANIFQGHKATVYSDGRSGGWAVVEGLPPIETWDAVMLGKWHQFEHYALQVVAAIPADTLCLIYENFFLPHMEIPTEKGVGVK